MRIFCSRYKNLYKEIAFYGGSFTLLSTDEQQSYLDGIRDFIGQVDGIRISTRPDGINEKSIDFALQQQIKTIELGIQSFSDRVLKETARPYDSEEAGIASLRIKKAGIRLGIQLMPGLPGETKDTIEETVERTIACKPDFVRLYPTLVLKGTPLEHMYRAGRFQPLSLKQAVDLCADLRMRFDKEGIQVIKTGLHSDLSGNKINEETPGNVTAGPYHPAFGELVSAEIILRNILKLYRPNKTLHISIRAVSLFRRDNERLLKELKKCLTVSALPVVIDKEIEKEKVFISENEAELLW